MTIKAYLISPFPNPAIDDKVVELERVDGKNNVFHCCIKGCTGEVDFNDSQNVFHKCSSCHQEYGAAVR